METLSRFNRQDFPPFMRLSMGGIISSISIHNSVKIVK